MQFEWKGKVYIIDGTTVARTVGDVLDFVGQHQEGILLSLPVIYGVANLVNKSKSERRRSDMEYQKSHSIWDPRHMHSWTLRRPLTNRERRELDRRVRLGEDMGDILEDMRVLR